MGLPGAAASLLRILWLAAAVFHSSALAAFNVHISTFHEQGTSVFNVSLSRNWTYVLHPTLTGKEAKEHVAIDGDTGEIYLKTEIDCSLLRENPLIVYAQAQARTTKVDDDADQLSYVMTPVAIHVHGNGCHPMKARKKLFDSEEEHTPMSATQPQQIMVEYPEGTCWFPGDDVLHLNDFLPKAFVDCPVSYSLDDIDSRRLFVNVNGILYTGKEAICVFEHQSEHIYGSVQIPSSCSTRQQSYWSNKEENDFIPLVVELRSSASHQHEC